MKILYLDCGMGAAGDMLSAALLELLPDPDGFIEEMNALGIPGVEIKKEAAVTCGITGSHVSVKVHGVEEGEEALHHHDHFHSHDGECFHGHTHDPEHERHPHGHHHASLHDVQHIIEGLRVPQEVKKDILEVYHLIAEAESHAHGVSVSQIHFHEVGMMDAIADITMVCMLMKRLSPDEVVVSPVHVGSGQVECAHGILPVPAPATAYILKGVPIYGGKIKGELCTPTGAALLKHFAARFGEMPAMCIQAIGYGIGKKEFPAADCVRAMLGDSEDRTDMVYELSCNIDDMTAEEMGFAMERLFEGGAREVYTVPVGMKKSRPGIWLCVICAEQDKEKMLELIFKYTTTIGVRESRSQRYILDRREEVAHTPYGDVRCKHSSGYGVLRCKYEYEDLAKIAAEHHLTIDEVRKWLKETL